MDLRGQPTRWPLSAEPRPICYNIYADNQDDLYYFGDAVSQAADLWSTVPGSAMVVEPCGAETEQIAILLQRSLTNEPFASGFAQFDRYNARGQPRHCSITIKTDIGYTSESVAKTILHELGHCLGLDHSLIPEAIMSYHTEQNTFALDLDDQAAISRLYPLGKSSVQLPPGCAVGADSRLPEGWQVSTALVVFLLLSPLGFGLIFLVFYPRLSPAFRVKLACPHRRSTP
jgi:hypothetical protein